MLHVILKSSPTDDKTSTDLAHDYLSVVVLSSVRLFLCYMLY